MPTPSWLEAVNEEEKRRKAEAERMAKAGTINYKEEAKKTRIQYALPQYQGKSQNQGKTYQWERDLMQNEKVKGAGNSYTKKFDALTARMGMTEGQASEFRKYMDWVEDSKHVDPKMNKDGKINQSQNLKYARDTHLETDVIDGILANMTKNQNARTQNTIDPTVHFEKVGTFDKIKNALGIDLNEFQKNTIRAKKLGMDPRLDYDYSKKNSKKDIIRQSEFNNYGADNSQTVNEERSGFLGTLDRTLGRAGNNATKVFGEQFANDVNQNYLNQNLEELKKNPEDAQALAQLQMLNATQREAENGSEKAADFIGRSLGEIAPYTIGGAYGAADAILGKLGLNAVKSPLVREAVRGATAGGVVGAGKSVVRDSTSEPEDFGTADYLKTIGLEAGLAGAGDAAIGAFARNINLKGLTKGLSDDVANQYAQALGGGRTPEQIALALRESITPHNVLADPKMEMPSPTKKPPTPNQDNFSNDVEVVLRQLLGEDAPKAPAETNPLDNFTPNAIPEVEIPNALAAPKDSIYDQLNFGQSSKYAPKARKDLTPAERSLDPMNRPQSYWKERYEGFADQLQKQGYNPNNLSKESLDELWTQYANYDEPVSLENAVDLAYGNGPQSKLNTDPGFDPAQRLEELLQPPLKINDWQKNAYPKDQLNGEYGQADVSGLDDMLALLQGETRSGRTIENAPTPGLPQNVNELIEAFKKNPEIVNNSQVGSADNELLKAVQEEAQATGQSPEEVIQDLVQTVAKEQPEKLNTLLMNLDGTINHPKAETEAVNPAPVSEEEAGKSSMLLRSNLQQFESDNPSIISDTKPIQSVSAIDSIKNPIKRRLNKFYENAVNSTHSAKVAHTQVLENAIKKLETSGDKPKKLAQLKDQLKSVKKNGSDLEKSIQNQAAAGNKAKTFLDGHMDNLQTALGSTKPEDMAEAIRYQVAMNIRWIWDKVNKDYVVGGGWDEGRVNSIVNTGVGNEKLKAFTDAMKGLTQERLDLALKHGLINKNAHTALSKNPFYIPMARDVTPGMDNVGRSLKEGTTKNKGKAGAYFIQSLGDGDAEALYKDPLETLMTGTFSLFKNIAKEDTHKQLYNMAKLDSDKLFSRIVSKKEFDSKGGIAVPTPKGTKYIQIQDDLQKMIQENDLPYDLTTLGKITSAFAGLKTRSLEYHVTGVPRDLAEGYLKGQINNPVKYLSELVKAAKEHNLSAKQAGAYFDRAYKDGMNGINQEQMMKEYARQNNNVKPFNPKDKESWKELTNTILRIADMPFKPVKALGQLSDELPRTVEVKATERAFNKQHGAKIENIKRALGQVDEKLRASEGVTDPFDPALQGVDKLKGQKQKLENMLNEYEKNLEREQTFRGRDIMNFSRAGRGGVAKHIRQYVIFANTTTQSKDKLVRSFIERPGATIGKVALLTAPLVYAEHVMHQNLSEGDKKIYDNLPNWAKQYNYTFVNDGSVYTIPKIQELALLTNPIEAILAGNKEDLNASARLAVKESVPYQIGNAAQGLVPNTDGSVTMRKNMQVPSLVVSPALDVAANDKLGFNRNAISFGDKFGRQDAKANKFTLDLFTKTFGNKARADYAQYLATQYPGDAGKYGVHILDYLMEPENTDKLDTMLQNLNPLQDRIYSKDGEVLGRKVVKNPPKKPAVKK